MKLSDIDKLYKKLSPEQSGVMAFEAIAREDDAELQAITDAQPKLYFVGTSLAYSRGIRKLTGLGLCYGVFYWKNYAILLHRLNSYKYGEEAINKITANLGSMELALVETCRQLAVSLDAVKKLGLIPEEDSYGEFADEALTDEYTEIFMSGM